MLHDIHHGVNPQVAYHHRYPPIDEQYILFVGKIEKKKNVQNIVKAFIVLKEKYSWFRCAKETLEVLTA